MTITEQLHDSMKACELWQVQEINNLRKLSKEADEVLAEIKNKKAMYAKKKVLTDEDKNAYAAILLSEQEYLRGKRLADSILDSNSPKEENIE